MTRRLTRKQSEFVAKYNETANPTEAAFAAYDTNRDVARRIGSENLSKPDIRRAIDEALKANNITPDRWAKVLDGALEAESEMIIGPGQTKTRPDHGTRLKAVDLSAKLADAYPHEPAAVVTALNTGMRDFELRDLQWEQLDFLRTILTVGKSKTDAGTGRTIPMNGALFEALAEHKKWYEENVCTVAPELYVFPFGKNRKYDPKRPISTFKTAWTNIRKKAGVCVRLHDLRHTLVTKLCESGAPEEVIMAIAGHVSRQMLKHYAHIRTEAKRKALEAVATSRPVTLAAERQAAASAS